jgi:hypothetical protein
MDPSLCDRRTGGPHETMKKTERRRRPPKEAALASSRPEPAYAGRSIERGGHTDGDHAVPDCCVFPQSICRGPILLPQQLDERTDQDVRAASPVDRRVPGRHVAYSANSRTAVAGKLAIRLRASAANDGVIAADKRLAVATRSYELGKLSSGKIPFPDRLCSCRAVVDRRPFSNSCDDRVGDNDSHPFRFSSRHHSLGIGYLIWIGAGALAIRASQSRFDSQYTRASAVTVQVTVAVLLAGQIEVGSQLPQEWYRAL